MPKKIQVEGEAKSAKVESTPSTQNASKADLSSALSKVRAEFRAKFEKIAQAININLDD